MDDEESVDFLPFEIDTVGKQSQEDAEEYVSLHENEKIRTHLREEVRNDKRKLERNHDAENSHRKVFVGQIPKSYSETDVQNLFQGFAVRSISLLTDPITKLSRGCAFVVFDDHESASLAIKKLHKSVTLPGMPFPLQVKESGNSLQLKLFVGGLDKLTTEIELKEVFGRFGKLDDVFVMKNEDGQCKGVAFVKFENHDDAKRAISALNDTEIFENSNFKVSVRFADTPKQRMTRRLLKSAPESHPSNANPAVITPPPFSQIFPGPFMFPGMQPHFFSPQSFAPVANYPSAPTMTFTNPQYPAVGPQTCKKSINSSLFASLSSLFLLASFSSQRFHERPFYQS